MAATTNYPPPDRQAAAHGATAQHYLPPRAKATATVRFAAKSHRTVHRRQTAVRARDTAGADETAPLTNGANGNRSRQPPESRSVNKHPSCASG
jgi:hypothetical protein